MNPATIAQTISLLNSLITLIQEGTEGAKEVGELIEQMQNEEITEEEVQNRIEEIKDKRLSSVDDFNELANSLLE